MNKFNHLIKDGAIEVKAGFQDNLLCIIINPTVGDVVVYVRDKDEYKDIVDMIIHYKIWLIHPELIKSLSL